MKYSIVTTLYNSEQYVNEFYDRTINALKRLGKINYEIIFVNDGSPDDSLNIVKNICKTDKNILIVNLSKNFGHHKALISGLEVASGDKIFLIDSDLEESPEWLLEFDKIMNKEKCEVVYGVQNSRKGKFFERITGCIFYWIFNLLSEVKIPTNNVTARLMNKKYVLSLLKYKENEIFLDGIFAITGYKQIKCEVKKENISVTTYSFNKKVDMFLNSIASFSSKPLIMVFYIGVIISFVSFIALLFILYQWVFHDISVVGWTSIIISIWIIGGLIMSFLGIIGIYLSKIFTETKSRPRVIIDEIINKKDNEK